MSRTSFKHSIPLVAFLMSLALIGWPVIDFMFTAILALAIGAGMLYGFLFVAHTIDGIIDYFYEMR